MKVIFDSEEFSDCTGLVRDHLDFVGIEPNTLLGHFFPYRLQELIEYCERNPRFHIVSHMKNGAGKINRPVEKAAFYLLAEGDADPGLICCGIQSQEELESLHVCKFLARS